MNHTAVERKAMIFNVQKYNMHDGPGIRTLVFFKGCPLRCKWCANPEGLERRYQVMYSEDYCIHCGKCAAVCPVGIHKMVDSKHLVDRTLECIGCRNCETTCIKEAVSIAGEMKSTSELMAIIEEDEAFYSMSGGGVTLGGGEVTAQPEFATHLLMTCKNEGINTAIETCGYANVEHLLKMAEYVDLFLFDIKHMDSEQHYHWTGVRNEKILENLKVLLEKGKNVRIRMPLLKAVNDSEEAISALATFIAPYKALKNFKGVDLLPYHKMGVNKYAKLDMIYPIEGDFKLSEDDLNRIESVIKRYDVPVTIVRH